MTINNFTPEYSQDTAAIEQQLTKLANEIFAEFPCDGSRLGAIQTELPTDLPAIFQKFVTPPTSSFVPPSFALPDETTVQKLAVPNDINGFVPHSLASRQVPVAAPHEFGLPNDTDLQKLVLPRESFNPLASATTDSPFYFLNQTKVFSQAETAYQPKYQHSAFDVNAVRRDFPILNERVNGHQLVWFDIRRPKRG